RALKRQVLAEAFDRFAGPGLEAPEIEVVESGDGRGWRTRVTLHVDDAGRIGPFAARSHRVVPVSTYALARPAIAEAALALQGEKPGRIELHAAANLAPLDVTAVTARVDRFLQQPRRGGATGAVVLDPPRSGAGRAVVEGVHALAPSAIAYVACDPVALARDLGTFRGLGWQIDALRGFDLFPHSHHFEVVALLTR
ncbi:unnamed protein product, partial [Penicillium discolor]